MRNFFGKALNLFTEDQASGRAILVFALPIFFLLLADSIMSYIFPIVVENNVGSNIILGIIMASSSVAGLVSDFTFPQLLKNKSWKFQIIAAILISILFPICLTLGTLSSIIYLFFLGSFIWGIYWEFMNFSQQSFILDQDKSGEYSKDWGILYLTYQITTVIGPIIGSLLITQTLIVSNLTLITIQIFALIFAVLIIGKYSTRKSSTNKTGIKETFDLIKEIKYWNILSKSVWPVMIVGITLSTINAVFWTIGGLFGKELFNESGLDWIVIVLFSGPTIIGSVLLTRILVKHRKKRFSQIFLILGSAFLCMLFLTGGSTFLILMLIALASFSLSFVGPLNEAVYSDLLDRLKKERLHLLGMSKANASIAYIVGPLFSGFIADKIGYLATFGILGVIGLAVGILLIIFTPRKLKLNQKEIVKVN